MTGADKKEVAGHFIRDQSKTQKFFIFNMIVMRALRSPHILRISCFVCRIDFSFRGAMKWNWRKAW
jgi:hypothetical protein